MWRIKEKESNEIKLDDSKSVRIKRNGISIIVSLGIKQVDWKLEISK